MVEPERDHNPIDLFLTAFDAPEPLFTAEQVSWWPPGALETLLRLGLLVPGASASHVICTGCGERHVEQVTTRRFPDGSNRYFIPCPDAVRVEISSEQLKQWQPDFMRFARLLKELLGIQGRVRDRVAGRLFRLGTTAYRQQSREVYMARGLLWSDSVSVIAELGQGNPILFVGGASAPTGLRWSIRPPAIVPLGSVLFMGADDLELDRTLIQRLVDGADDAAAAVGELNQQALSRRVDRLTRRRLAQGSDEDMIGAFSSQGMSSREIEAEMKKRDVPIDHSTIARKKQSVVGAKGTPASSRSILRGPSSQPRDKKGRAMWDAQPEPD